MVYHVGVSFACSDFFLQKKSIARAAAPPFSQKGPLGSSARLHARLRRLAVAATFLRVRLRRERYLNCSLFPPENPAAVRVSGYKEVYLLIRRYSPHKGYAVFSCFSVSFASVCGSVGKWISPTKLKTISTF